MKESMRRTVADITAVLIPTAQCSRVINETLPCTIQNVHEIKVAIIRIEYVLATLEISILTYFTSILNYYRFSGHSDSYASSA